MVRQILFFIGASAVLVWLSVWQLVDKDIILVLITVLITWFIFDKTPIKKNLMDKDNEHLLNGMRKGYGVGIHKELKQGDTTDDLKALNKDAANVGMYMHKAVKTYAEETGQDYPEIPTQKTVKTEEDGGWTNAEIFKRFFIVGLVIIAVLLIANMLKKGKNGRK